ncbi:MAG: HAD hydrolase-like protein [Kiritimatiellae bacterium]|nr:HAD hydrolase-like protein [Kiritimatiellia bacterium]
MFDIAKKKAFVCDLDGTLFMGPNPIKSAVDFVIESMNSGRFRFFYLTNNTSKCPEEYMKKISGAAIPVVPEQILTPLITLESYIREKGYKSVYLISSEKVKAHMAERLADAGVSLDYDPERNELIALTYDKELTYDKLAKATSLWNMRNCPPSPMCPVRTKNQAPVDFVATHPDNCCPSERGPIPDIGGMMKFLETTNGMKPSHVFGKPSPTLLAPVLALFAPEEIAVVGDRLYTDKAIADNAGVDFVCVLSGETTPEDLENYRGTPPAIVVETFDKVQYAKGAAR